MTDDLDFGVNADIRLLRKIKEFLLASGFEVELREPDAEDPLGGLIDVRGDFGLIQIVSFADRFLAVIEDAIKQATLIIGRKQLLKIAPLEHIIALKIYAGGTKSKIDVNELLLRNPDIDLENLRSLCRRYHLKGLDDFLK